ncbi:MAG: bidirectional hydrogenase complex protein HoxU [Chloroflexi bacterium]|nr:bidirectional hydrogenase complex protein HoxU [Chloroflexota bacterium]
MPQLTLTIDGQGVVAQPGQTILDAARAANIAIPTLCHLDGLTPVGACRVCMVTLQPSGRMAPACTALAENGMEIVTDSADLTAFRRDVVALLFAERNHVCSICVANGHCELQDGARALGLDHIPFDYRFPIQPIDASHPRFVVDHNRCILCTRCVRVCDEIEGAHTWDVMGRGIHTRVVTDLNQPWGASPTCTSCGKCVQVCPTGALFVKGAGVGEVRRDRSFLRHLLTMRERPR